MKPQTEKDPLTLAERENLCREIQSLLEAVKGLQEVCAELEELPQSCDKQEILGATAFATNTLAEIEKVASRARKTLWEVRQAVKARNL